jgi:hypothetical protein
VLTERRETVAEQSPTAVRHDPDVEAVCVHAVRARLTPSIGRQSWIETQRRIGKSS